MARGAERSLSIGGVLASPVTPFTANGDLALGALPSYLEQLLMKGATALVVCGTIGELPTLSRSEWTAVVRESVAVASDRVPLMATVGHTDLREVRRALEEAARLGCAAVVVVTPYYHALSSQEVVTSYRSVSEVGVPFIPYNHPRGAGASVGPRELAEIAGFDNFVGLKDASPNLQEYLKKQRILEGRAPIIVASESVLFFHLAAGATACLTALSSFAPDYLTALFQVFEFGDLDRARRLNADLMAFRRIVEDESEGGRPGFITVSKAALDILGRPVGPPRPPLLPLSDARKAEIELVLTERLGLR